MSDAVTECCAAGSAALSPRVTVCRPLTRWQSLPVCERSLESGRHAARFRNLALVLGELTAAKVGGLGFLLLPVTPAVPHPTSGFRRTLQRSHEVVKLPLVNGDWQLLSAYVWIR